MDSITYHPLGDDIGFVSLIGYLGSDLSVVNAARVSYGKQSEEFTDKDARLIRYLVTHSHGTPFEHVVFQFRVRAPLFVVHQWERHRISSFNEESARYVEMRPDFYIKKDQWSHLRADSARRAFTQYQQMIAEGCSKEDARSVLPTSLYKELWWTVNARSLMNFIELRADEDAQEEIRLYAEALDKIFEQTTPALHHAFINNARIAP